MTKAEKLAMCRGCKQNFYNDNNPLGVKECWSLATAKLVSKVRVGINERPPWNGPVVKVFQCRQEAGVVLMSPENRDANNRACMAAMRREPTPQEGERDA